MSDLFLLGRWVSVGALLVIACGGCGETRTCYEGDFSACTCEDGRDGYAGCDAANDLYGACGSCGLVPGALTGGAGGGAGGGGTGGAALLGFMETCLHDEDCATGLCHTYNAKGPKCSLACQSDGDCPLPSPGCNNMGVCKAP